MLCRCLLLYFVISMLGSGMDVYDELHDRGKIFFFLSFLFLSIACTLKGKMSDEMI